MNIIKKLINKYKLNKQKAALEYMFERFKIATCGKMTMKEYFDKNYRANCYYYSTYFLLCMNKTDKLVRGKIFISDYDCFSNQKIPNYEHGWIEFEYNGNWFVYDDHYKYPVLLKDYYKAVSPYKIYKKFTQEELVVYLKKEYPNKTNITEDEDYVYIKTGDLYDYKYNIPFYNLDLFFNKDMEIAKVQTEKLKYVDRREPIVDWC